VCVIFLMLFITYALSSWRLVVPYQKIETDVLNLGHSPILHLAFWFTHLPETSFSCYDRLGTFQTHNFFLRYKIMLCLDVDHLDLYTM